MYSLVLKKRDKKYLLRRGNTYYRYIFSLDIEGNAAKLQMMTFASLSICYFILWGYGCYAYFMCVLSYPSGFFTPLYKIPFLLYTYSWKHIRMKALSSCPIFLTSYTLILGWSSVSANRANGGDALTNWQVFPFLSG